MSAALIEAARDALEAWDSLPRKTYSLSTSVSEWLEYRMAPTIARLRAALAAAERPAPKALLVRDIAADFGVTPLKVIEALRLRGLGGYSVNMAVTAEMAQELRSHFSRAAAEQPAEPVALTPAAMKRGGFYNWKNQPDRLIYLRRFDGWHQFKKIGDPREVWCEVLDGDLHMLEETAASPAAPAQAPLTDEQLSALILATVYEGDERIPYRDYWTRDIGEPFARAIERAHGIGSKA